MFSLHGRDVALQNIYCIAQSYAGRAGIRTTEDLRSAYRRFLREHQPYMPVNDRDDPIVFDASIEQSLVQAYSFNNTLDDLGQTRIIGRPYAKDERAPRVKLVREALAEFLSLDDELATVFQLVIHSIVIRPSTQQAGRMSHGGSSSAAMGVIWLSLSTAVDRIDVIEMLLHELTHHLLFVDERNYPHFDYGQIAQPTNYAYSAILNLQRPVDKVFHSIVVASELLLGRERFLPDIAARVHPVSSRMRVNAARALDELRSVPAFRDVVRERGRDILCRCDDACALSPVKELAQ